MEIVTRNVNTAFKSLVTTFKDRVGVVEDSSRNGPVLKIEEPVMIRYTHPKERVLINYNRNANPFLHMYEALWMIDGRNDVGSLAFYAKNMLNYSDDGITMNGAYGYRWRYGHTYEDCTQYCTQCGTKEETICASSVDQLEILIDHLTHMPESRRAVLQMWNVEDDLLKIGLKECGRCGGSGCYQCDKGGGDYKSGETGSKDVCCNLSVIFSIRDCSGWNSIHDEHQELHYLDMTVFNRSNDLIWGTLGANAVHFSFLQEYMANMLGVEVGYYNQISNNLHVYLNNFDPLLWLETCGECIETRDFKLVENKATFRKELQYVLDRYKSVSENDHSAPLNMDHDNCFLDFICIPMFEAFRAYKLKDKNMTKLWMSKIEHRDWQLACAYWITKRGGM